MKKGIIETVLCQKKSKEICVSCEEETPYDVSMDISLRQCYVEGAGQLCLKCWKELYEEWENRKDNDGG